MGELISGIGSLIGGSSASSAAKEAAQAQLEMYYQTRSDLLPYNTAGQSVLSDLVSVAKSGLTGGGPDYVTQAAGERPGQMTQAELEKTPGYQWNLAQGLKATQSAAAAKGLGVSGASLKGAATYATGLADSTYQNQFNNQQTRFQDLINLNTAQQGNLTNYYNRLSGVATLGENAAATTGAQGTQAASNYGNYLTQSGALQASGISGFSSGLGSSFNQLLGLSMGGGTSGYGNNSGGGGLLSSLFGGGGSGYIDSGTWGT